MGSEVAVDGETVGVDDDAELLGTATVQAKDGLTYTLVPSVFDVDPGQEVLLIRHPETNSLEVRFEF